MTKPPRSPKAHKEGLTLKAAALALGYLSEAEFDSWVRPEQMVGSMKAGVNLQHTGAAVE